jgi:hypothetical protein
LRQGRAELRQRQAARPGSKYRRLGSTDFVEHTYGTRRGRSSTAPTVRGVWTPTPDEQLTDELQAALARPHASHMSPRPVALATEDKVVGWLWGRMQTADGAWLGLATLYPGTLFDGAELGWHPAAQLRLLD